MKVFIAGSFSARERLKQYRDRLRDNGYDATASWLDEPHETWPNYENAKYQAIRDIQEIKQANVFILDTIDLTTLGNSYVELGFALGRMIPRYIVGPLRNHYCCINNGQFDTWEELIGFLGLYPHV